MPSVAPSPHRREVLPLPVGARPDLGELLPALRAALAGAGPALLPVAAGAPAPPLPRDLPDDGPGTDPVALVVPTSGSTGSPKLVALPASALLASAAATHDRLGGPGHWLLALPVQHVAGLQVLVRSLVADRPPVALDLAGGFTAEGFAAAAARVHGPRRYTALVPTQLVRLLAAGDAAVAALAGFDAVLLGGAAAPAPLLERAAAAGVRVLTTYGMTETCGGCVYDGVPLDGVTVRLGDDPENADASDGTDAGAGRIMISGPVLAAGYAGAPADAATSGPGAAGGFRTGPDGRRWFVTADHGRWHDGRVQILGRLDDVVVTGGRKVSPAAVEAALLRLPEVAEAVVVGVPDDEWGQRVAAALVLRPGARQPRYPDVRAWVSETVAPYAVPRQVTVLAELPTRGPGKPDRARVAELLAGAAGTGRAPGTGGAG